MSFNGFGCPVSSLSSHNEICDPPSMLAKKTKKQKAFHSCGIWTYASYINHCCIGNAHRAFIGDMMIVRASQDMEPGTEITFWYDNPDTLITKELGERFRHWGFVCQCAICLDAKATDAEVFKKRKQLVEKLIKAFKPSTLLPIEIGNIERLLAALNETYNQAAEHVPRLLLWDFQLALTRIYASQNNVGESMKSAVKVLTLFGFVVAGADSSQTRFTIVKWGVLVDQLVKIFLNVQAAFMAMGAREDSERAKEYAKITYKILVGEDMSFDAIRSK